MVLGKLDKEANLIASDIGATFDKLATCGAGLLSKGVSDA